ncbi:MAG: Ni/Fe hydrogenase subunit alpha [Candidatus Thorarchaeota archaeon]|nr:MAG: Ni/Fe hydrogenase subunit alpha [Candidatus Thorarchaeota archaeon]
MAKRDTIEIKPLARVEGNGGIRVEIEDNRIINVEVQILEGPRLFETLVIGKTPEEILSLVPRICAICNLSHKYASLRGLEKALDVRIPEVTDLYRHLMHHGEIIESHSLHLYMLALPDFFGYTNAVEMAVDYGEIVTKALQMKALGNKIMRAIGGRMIHGENPVLGGFGKLPDRECLLSIQTEAKDGLAFALETIEILADLEIPDHMERDTQFLCCKPPHNEYGYYGDVLITSDGKEHPAEDYQSVIEERVVSHSFAKRSSYGGRPFTVGALARVNLLGERLKGEARKAYDGLIHDRWLRNPLYNNFAQAIEQVYSLEGVIETIDRLTTLKEPETAEPNRESGVGTGAVEAPRGTLIHHYMIENGRAVAADYVTPTAMFLDDVEEFIRESGERLISTKTTVDLELQFEMIARAYDPCISCSAHLVTVEYK